MVTQADDCASCYGTGEISGLRGPERCPDCGGVGRMPTGVTLVERRLRELEQRHDARGGELAVDVRWLASEVRRAHHALLQILAASQDAPEGDPIAGQIRYLANEVLRVYATEVA